MDGGDGRSPMAACRPRLFIYDELPARYRDDHEGGFGSPASPLISPLHRLPAGVRLWHTAEFGLGGLFAQRARAYRCRTSDASLADIFFVPAFSSKQHHRPTERAAEGGDIGALYRRLRTVRVSGRCPDEAANCSALEARGGADHILVNPRNGAPYERHPYVELDYMDPRLGNATLLDLMEPGDWPWFGNYQPEERYHSVPHPSLVHLEAGVKKPPWRSTHRRGALVVGAFGLGHGPKPVVALRAALRHACTAAPETVCSFLRLGDKSARAGNGTRYHPVPSHHSPGSAATSIEEPGWHSVARLYWNGTFCLQPPGDAVSRKAIVDALLLGCIPVLFHEGQAGQWPWHWGSWQENASVLLNMTLINQRKLDPIVALRAIPPSRVALMQDTIAAHAHVMQYAAVDTSNLSPLLSAAAAPRDAFDVALEGAWARSIDAHVVKTGVRLQKTAGAALDAALEIFKREPEVGSWGGRSSDTCSRTWGTAGDCQHGDSGTWRLGYEFGIVSIDDCAEKCHGCARCRWISHSHVHQQCDWYASCNTSKLNRRFGGETFRTREVVH